MSYRNTMFFILLLSLVSSPEITADDVVAYQGATIETVGKAGAIADGIVVVRDGKIEAVGADVSIPTDARIVDTTGQTIMPALVDVYHPVTVAGATSATASRTIVVGGRTFTIAGRPSTTAAPFMKLSDNVDPLSLKSNFKTQARYGVGLMNVVTRGFGQAITARADADNAEESVVNKDGVLFLAVTNTTSSLDALRKGLKGGSSTSSSRSGVTASRSRVSRSGSTISASVSRTPSTTTSSSTDLQKAWIAVKEGKAPILINVSNAAAIMYVLEILKEFDKAKVILVASGANVYRTIDQIKGRNVSILLRAGIDIAPRSSNRINVAGMLEAADIKFGFSSSLDSSLSVMPDTPFIPVTMLVKTGLSRKAALEALTLSPARMLGVDKTLGSVEVGKQANLIFLDGDPLAAASKVQRVVVEGKSVYED